MGGRPIFSPDAAAIQAKIAKIQMLKTDELRDLWRAVFKKEIPDGLTPGLQIRTLCWKVQEQAYGGHGPAITKMLASYAKGKPGGTLARRLKPGTEIVREFQGERHTVVITSDGFRWRDQDYASLTAIARAITGTNWNGPRFFGLREGVGGKDGVGPYVKGSTKPKRAGTVRSGVIA